VQPADKGQFGSVPLQNKKVFLKPGLHVMIMRLPPIGKDMEGIVLPQNSLEGLRKTTKTVLMMTGIWTTV